MKYLLIISKNYWGADRAEYTANNFLNLFSKFLNIPNENIFTLVNSDVNVNTVKNILYDFLYKNYNINESIQQKFYIYINGHGNQITDTNGDEIIDINENETPKDSLDEIYQLPDGNIVDDDITNIIISAIKTKVNSDNIHNIQFIKPFVCLVSDHCSSGSMIDVIKNEQDKLFDWITIGSSLDNQDSLMTGDGNVMTINLLNVLTKLQNENKLENITALEFNELFQKEMKESFIGDLQTATFHVSHENMLLYKLFN